MNITIRCGAGDREVVFPNTESIHVTNHELALLMAAHDRLRYICRDDNEHILEPTEAMWSVLHKVGVPSEEPVEFFQQNTRLIGSSTYGDGVGFYSETYPSPTERREAFLAAEAARA